MTATDPPLLVFADDWGRHPSSCQHLIRQLLPRRAVWWVNTIGTRPPRLDWGTVKRAAGKLRSWLFPVPLSPRGEGDQQYPSRPSSPPRCGLRSSPRSPAA